MLKIRVMKDGKEVETITRNISDPDWWMDEYGHYPSVYYGGTTENDTFVVKKSRGKPFIDISDRPTPEFDDVKMYNMIAQDQQMMKLFIGGKKPKTIFNRNIKGKPKMETEFLRTKPIPRKPKGFDNTIWLYHVSKAIEDKRWAEKTRRNPKWMNRASEMSKRMLDDRLNKSIEQLARDSYRYHEMRAGLKTERGDHIAPDMWRKWKKLKGLKIKDEGDLKKCRDDFGKGFCGLIIKDRDLCGQFGGKFNEETFTCEL